MFGGLASSGCLGGVVLGFAEFGDGFDEPGEAGHERELGQDDIAAGERGTGHETGGAAQVVPGRGWTRNASVGHAGGAVVGVGGLADHPVAQELGRDVEGVGGGPGGVGSGVRVGEGEFLDLLRGVSGGAGGVLVEGVALC